MVGLTASFMELMRLLALRALFPTAPRRGKLIKHGGEYGGRVSTAGREEDDGGSHH